MRFPELMKGTALTALALALGVTALPSEAFAQRGDRGRYNPEEREQAQVEIEVPQQAGQERRTQRRQPAAPQVSPAAEQRSRNVVVQAGGDSPQQRRGRDWNRSDRRSDVAQERYGRDWNRGQQQAQIERNRAQAELDRQRAQTLRDQRNRSYTDNSRNTTYRDGYRDGRRADNRQDRRDDRNAYRSGYRDGSRYDNYRDQRSNYRQDRRWDRNSWRRDSRYNWYSYRNYNRDLYRAGRYYSPYRDYRYSRLNIGIRLGSAFYGNRYWINDPWRYRLPEVYGPYRWVRYYDDVLLVDVYSGQVVDVIYDFFW